MRVDLRNLGQRSKSNGHRQCDCAIGQQRSFARSQERQDQQSGDAEGDRVSGLLQDMKEFLSTGRLQKDHRREQKQERPRSSRLARPVGQLRVLRPHVGSNTIRIAPLRIARGRRCDSGRRGALRAHGVCICLWGPSVSGECDYRTERRTPVAIRRRRVDSFCPACEPCRQQSRNLMNVSGNRRRSVLPLRNPLPILPPCLCRVLKGLTR
jgi:hypothetical protein